MRGFFRQAAYLVRLMTDLFGDDAPAQEDTALRERAGDAPLADRLRPQSLGEVIGQEHLTGPQGAIGRMVSARRLSSMILWGPPGTGKTSIARLLADAVGIRFVSISAVFSGVADLKKAFAEADRMAAAGKKTLLFVDEIHRFNRAQQDGFLPFVERGTVTLVGATTENPSFALNAALLSRAQVLILERLGSEALEALLTRAEVLEGPLPLTSDARAALIASADGDGRFLLGQAETLYNAKLAEPLDPQGLGSFLQRRVAVYDKDRDGHYNLISALHKSLRGSDPQAALYYLARMLTAGQLLCVAFLIVAASTARAASFALPARTLASLIRRRSPNALPQRTPINSSAALKASSRLSKPASTAPPRPNRTPPIQRKNPHSAPRKKLAA